MLFVDGKAACGDVGLLSEFTSQIAVNPEKAQTLPWQGIALAAGNVAVLGGRSHRYDFHLGVSVVFFPG